MPIGLLTGLGAALAGARWTSRRPGQPGHRQPARHGGRPGRRRDHPDRGRHPDEHPGIRPIRPPSPTRRSSADRGRRVLRLLHRAARRPDRRRAGWSRRTAGLTVVLSVVLRGETLTMLQALGAAGRHRRRHPDRRRLRWRLAAAPGSPAPAVVFAVVALILFAIMAIPQSCAIDRGSLQVPVLSRS